MNPTPTTRFIIFETTTEQSALPYAWLLRGRALMKEAQLTLVFAGLKVDIATPTPVKLLKAIAGGSVSHITSRAVVTKVPDGTYVVEAITYRDEE